MSGRLKVALVAAIVGVFLLGVILSITINTDADAYLAASLAVTGVMCFFGMLFMAQAAHGGGPFRSADTRIAIAAAFVVVYIETVAVFLFNHNLPSAFGQGLSGNLTTLTGLVLGYYFATSGAIEFVKLRGQKDTQSEHDSTQSEDDDQP